MYIFEKYQGQHVEKKESKSTKRNLCTYTSIRKDDKCDTDNIIPEKK